MKFLSYFSYILLLLFLFVKREIKADSYYPVLDNAVYEKIIENYNGTSLIEGNLKQLNICIPPRITDGCPPPNPPNTFGYFVSSPVKQLHDDFFRKFFKIILEKGVFFNGASEREKNPFDFKTPEELEKLIDFKLGTSTTSQEDLLKIIEDVIKYSPHTSHPFFLHRRAVGLDPYGLASDWIITVMSTVMLTYLFAPVFTLMEIELLKNVRGLIGYEGKSDGIHGIGTPYPNGYALQLALNNKYPNFKLKGLSGIGFPDVAIFLSEDADYTTIKSAAFEGIGLESAIRIETDKNGRMNVQALKDAIAKAKNEGKAPLMIIATAGTPILGAIDPIDEIAKVAAENEMWLHIDGECGGSLLFSDSKKVLLNGIEKSDSFSFGPHCLLNGPFEINYIFTKKDDLFNKTFALNDPVEFKTTTLYNLTYDRGDATIQTSRRADIFKLWFMWKAKGQNELGNHIDYIFNLRDYATNQIKMRDGFKLILEQFDLPLISYNYIPKSLRNSDQNSEDYGVSMNKFTDNLKNTLLKNGIAQIAHSTSTKENMLNFLTMNLENSALTEADIDYVLDQIESAGENSPALKSIQRPNPPVSYPSFVSSPIESLHKDLFNQTFDLILDKGLYFQEKRNEPSLIFKKPEDLYKIFDFSIGKEGVKDTASLINIMKELIKYSAHQSHPYWLYQLLAGLDPYSIAAEILVSTLQSPMITYEDSPAFTLMENEVFKTVWSLVGYQNGEGDGIITPGGSLANTYAVLMAKERKNSQTKLKGNKAAGNKMVYYISKDAHYSLVKAAFYAGLGRENCIEIDIDSRGKMNSRALENAIRKTISEGGIPFMIGATAGTTILGAIDPLNEIADLCQKYNLYFHVDGAFGGTLLFSNNYRSRIRGIERADSFSFNPTKMLASPVTCTCFISKHKNIFKDSFALGSPIDFANDTTLYDKSQWDNGDKNYQRVRKANMVKFWLLWKAKGSKGISDHIDYIMRITDHAVNEMRRRRPNFELYLRNVELTNVCFMYVPTRLIFANRRSKYFKNEMDKISFKIQSELVLQGIAVIVAQYEQDSPLLLKLVLMNSALTNDDVNYIIWQIQKIGRNL